MIKTFSKNRNRKWLTFFFIELWLTIFCLKQEVVFGERRWVGYGAKRHFQQYFSYIVAVSFIGAGNRSNRRKPPTCCKSLTNFIT